MYVLLFIHMYAELLIKLSIATISSAIKHCHCYVRVCVCSIYFSNSNRAPSALTVPPEPVYIYKHIIDSLFPPVLCIILLTEEFQFSHKCLPNN